MPGRLRSMLPALLAAAVACTGPAERSAAPAPSPASAEQPAPVVTLDVRLAKFKAAALKGRPGRGPLRGPAEEIRRTITDLYLAGFVDPARWAAGFRGVVDAFAPEARVGARRDLRQLSLGGAARSLSEVRPIRARIVVEFLTDERRRPVAALTDMEFSGTGVGDGFEVPIRHDGEYVLEPFGRRWLITGYEVDGRIGA